MINEKRFNYREWENKPIQEYLDSLSDTQTYNMNLQAALKLQDIGLLSKQEVEQVIEDIELKRFPLSEASKKVIDASNNGIIIPRIDRNTGNVVSYDNWDIFSEQLNNISSVEIRMNMMNTVVTYILNMAKISQYEANEAYYDIIKSSLFVGQFDQSLGSEKVIDVVRSGILFLNILGDKINIVKAKPSKEQVQAEIDSLTEEQINEIKELYGDTFFDELLADVN